MWQQPGLIISIGNLFSATYFTQVKLFNLTHRKGETTVNEKEILEYICKYSYLYTDKVAGWPQRSVSKEDLSLSKTIRDEGRMGRINIINHSSRLLCLLHLQPINIRFMLSPAPHPRALSCRQGEIALVTECIRLWYDEHKISDIHHLDEYKVTQRDASTTNQMQVLT